MSGFGYPAPRLVTARDDLSDFTSGEDSLDVWLRTRALPNQFNDASRTYVAVTADRRIMGYYCLSAGSVLRAGLPGRVRRNQPDPVPVVVLGRLAVAKEAQKFGWGAQLLRDAITRSVQVADVIGARALMVNALHERAKEFYLHMGFDPSPVDELTLFLPMQDARYLLGDPG